MIKDGHSTTRLRSRPRLRRAEAHHLGTIRTEDRAVALLAHAESMHLKEERAIGWPQPSAKTGNAQEIFNNALRHKESLARLHAAIKTSRTIYPTMTATLLESTIHVSLGNPARSLPLLKPILGHSQQSIAATANECMAVALSSLGASQEATLHFLRAMELDPQKPFAAPSAIYCALDSGDQRLLRLSTNAYAGHDPEHGKVLIQAHRLRLDHGTWRPAPRGQTVGRLALDREQLAGSARDIINAYLHTP